VVNTGASATAGAVAYADSSASTTATDYYPSSGPLMRKMQDAGSSTLATSTDTSPCPQPAAEGGEGDAEELEEPDLLHLHDFLLNTSTPSAPLTTKLEYLSDLNPSAPPLHNDNSFTQPPVKLEQSNQLQPPSSPQSRNASPSTAHPSSHDNECTRRRSSVTSSPREGQGDFPVPPPRRMVRRNLSIAGPQSPVEARRVTASFTVRESRGVLTADVSATGEHVVYPSADHADTSRSFEAATPTGTTTTPTVNSRTPADLLTPSFQGNAYADIDAAAHAATMAAGLTTDLPIRESFPIPRYCPDDLLRGEDKLWSPGKPLRIAYVTWNMANKEPRMDEVSAYCIHPNAHLIVVGTQENGPYVGSNKLQNKWARTIGEVCLSGQYELVGKHHMWAVQMLVFARKRDVAKYVSHAHASHVKTGMLNGLGGNKGGVAVGLVLSLTPKLLEVSHAATTQRAVTTAPSTPRGERVSLPPVLRVDEADGGTAAAAAAASPSAEADTSDVQLSPSAVAGPLPPALLNASVMQHDADDDDDANANPHTLQAGLSNYASGDDHADNAYCVNASGLDDNGVFSPAEMISRNASFDISRERQRRRKQKRRLRHSFKRKDRANGGGGSHSNNTNNRNGGSDNRGYYDDDSSSGTPDSNTPNYMTLLFITAHLAAHQGAVVNRNKDYREIVHGLQLGRRGPHKKFFKRLLKQRKVLGDAANGDSGDEKEQWDDDSSEDDVVPLRLPVVSAIVNRSNTHRDVTEEFDLTLFGGDLNYRINGTRKAIEYVIQHHRNIRSILINNDQLSLERARGTVFQGYQEGNLLFRPTYKYEVSPSNGGVTLDEYNFSRKKDRMPAYCDRVLFKKKPNSAARRVAIRLYTDVPNVRTSDHRPVVALFDVGTRAYTG
jgi:hypothetical protein